MRLMMATLFTSGEEQSTYFRQEADPDETQSIITGMLGHSNSGGFHIHHAWGHTLLEMRKCSRQSLYPGWAEARLYQPHSPESLFEHKPMVAVLTETEQNRLNKIINSISYSQYRGASISQRKSTLLPHQTMEARTEIVPLGRVLKRPLQRACSF